MFMLSNIGSYATEGSAFSFDVTPESALLVDKRIRWEIIFRGDIPAFSSDFISMSGDLDFVSGATASQTITLSIADDNSYEIDREFVIRVWDTNNTADDISDDTRIGEDAVVILQDDDTNNFTNSVNAFTGLGDNTFTAASSIFLNFVSANGDDSFIITRFQYGDVRINDTAGSSYIKFDRGVTIEAINEEVVSFGGREVTSVDLILSTGSTITIEAPTKPEFQYQLGDSRVLDYGDFISTLGTVSASLPYVVTGSSTVATPDDGFRNVIGLYRTVGDDIMGLGSDFDLNVTGGLGDDSFIITRFQTGDVRIKDVAGSSYIKFDRGMTIVSVYEEVVSFGGREVTSVDLILSTGSTINIDAPTKPEFQYQFGDGDLLNYEDFVSALSSVVVSVAGDVSSDRYVVGGVIFGAGPYHYSVSENLDASGVGNAMVLGSISATVTSGETLNYAFDGGTLTDSLGHFAITSVGEISYIGSGLDRETTSVHYLKVQATSSDGSVDVVNISIEVDNVNEVPVLLSMIGSQTVTIGVDLDVSSFFEDGDVASSGDELTYTAMRVDSGGVNPTALPSGLSINADAGFSASTSAVAGVTHQVEVTATDSGGLSVVSNVFALYVNTAPIVVTGQEISDRTLELGVADTITIADSNDTTSNVFSDVDGDALTYTATLSNGSSLPSGITFGEANGVTQLVFDSLVAVGVYDFIITATDTHNVSVTESFSVMVAINTAPAFSSNGITFTNNDSTVTEDDSTDDRVSGALSFNDVDSGDTLASLLLHVTNDGTPPTASIGELTFTSGEASIVGTYGTFTFMRDSVTSEVTWTYLLDSADSDTNALDSGAMETESVQLLVRDDENAVSSVETLSVTVEGSNDDPAFSSTSAITFTNNDSTITENDLTNNRVSGALSFSDVDSGDTLATLSLHATNDGTPPTASIGLLTFTSGVASVVGMYGTFTFTRDATTSAVTWTYVLNNSNSMTDALDVGVSVTDSVQLLVRDDDNAVSSVETLTVNIEGSNDDPAFSSTSAITFTGNDSTITENDSTDNRVSGALSFSDVDTGDTLATLLLHATNDGTAPTASIGELTFTSGETSIGGTYGTFTFTRDATTSAVTWTYVLNNSNSMTDALDSGAIETESVQLLVRDDDNAVSSVETLSVTVEGSNDAPVFSSNAITNNNDTVTEDDSTDNRVSGALSFSDVDTGDTLATLSLHATNDGTAPTASIGELTFTSDEASIGGTYGTFTFMRDASTSTVTWTYELDNTDSDTNALGSGVSVTESVQLLVRDDGGAVSSVETLSVTVEGSNDNPVLENTISDVILAPNVSSSITIADSNNTASNVFSDVDTGDTLTYTLKIEDATGTFIDTLPSGITWDNTTGDEALIFADTVALGVYNFQLMVTDSDSLSVTEVFSVTVSTAPVVANAIGNKVFSPGVSNFTFADNTFTDADTGDTLAYTALLVNADGSVSSLPTGLSFTPSTRTFDIATTLDVGTYTIRVTATDPQNLSVTDTFSVTVSTAPVIVNPIVDKIFAPNVSDSITIADSSDTASNVFTDPEGGTLTYMLQIEDAMGTFVDTLPSGITWDNTTGDEALIFSDTVALGVYNFQLTATDSQSLSVTEAFRVTVSTAPVVANAIDDKIFSPGVSNFTFADNAFTDADTGDTLAYTALLVNADGSVSSLPTGLSFTPSTRTFDIATTLDVGTYTIRVTATDPQNLSVTDTFSITVSTTPVVVTGNEISDVTFAFGETGEVVIADSNDTTRNVFSDADTGDTLTYTLQIEDATGTFVDTFPSGITWDNTMGDEALIFADTVALGVYNFKLTATDTYGLSVTEIFSVTVNPAPVVANAIDDEIYDPSASGTITIADSSATTSNVFSDPDDDALIYTVAQTDGSSLPTGITLSTETISTVTTTQIKISAYSVAVGVYDLAVTATDTYGLSVTDTFKVTVSTAPAFSSNAITFTDNDDVVTEDDSTDNRVSGALAFGDVDSGADSPPNLSLHATTDGTDPTASIGGLTFTSGEASIDGVYGTFTFIRDGDATTPEVTWRYDLNNADSDTNALDVGDTVTDSVRLLVRDTRDVVSSVETLTVIVVGSNDAPVIVNPIIDKIYALGVAGTITIADSNATTSNVFTDPEGGTLTYVAKLVNPNNSNNLIALPNGMSLSSAGVTKTEIVILDTVAVGVYDLAVTATDPRTVSTTDRFRVTVSTAPVIVTGNEIGDEIFAFGEEGEVVIADSSDTTSNVFSDADTGDILSYTLEIEDANATGTFVNTLPSGITWDSTTGDEKLIFADTVALGVYNFKLTATDPQNLSVTDTFRITVNTRPVIVNVIDDGIYAPGVARTITIADSSDTTSNVFSDADGDALTYTLEIEDTTGTFVNIDTSPSPLPSGVTWSDNATGDATLSFADTVVLGVYNFQLTATDTQNLSVTETFKVTVGTRPVVENTISDMILAPNVSSSITIADSNNTASNVFSDADIGDSLSYSVTLSDGSSLPSGMTFGEVSGVWRLDISALVALGVYNFKLTATDTQNLSVTETFTVTVDTAPVVENVIDDVILARGVSGTITIADSNNTASNVFSDVDTGDTLTYTAMRVDPNDSNNFIALPDGMSLFTTTTNAVTTTMFVIFDTVAVGDYDLAIKAMDMYNLSVTTAIFRITVNTAPVVSNSISDVPLDLGESHRITIADSSDTTSNVFSDADGDTLTYMLQIEDVNAMGTFVDTLPSGVTWSDNGTGDVALIFDSSVALGIYNFQLTATDMVHGLSVTETFSVMNGTAPAFSSTDAITNNNDTVTEDDLTNNRVSGALSFSDDDSDDTLASLSLHATNDGTDPTASIGELTFTSGEASIDGVYGTFTFMRDAVTSEVTWRYDLDNADLDTDTLDVGDSQTDNVRLLVRDMRDVVSSVETLSVTVVGSSDLMNPVELSLQGSASVTGVTLSGDVDTDLNVIVVKGNNTTVTSSVSDSRFALDSNYNLIAQSGAVFDYTTEPIVSITIKIVVTDANGSMNVETIDAIVNVVTETGPVFSLGTSSGTIADSVSNLALNTVTTTTVDTDITQWYPLGDVDTPEEHIANINDGDTDAVIWGHGSAVSPKLANDKYIRFDLDGDNSGETYIQGSFVYHNRNDGSSWGMGSVYASTVEFIRNDVTVYSKMISNTDDIVTITAPVGTVFDTARIVFSGNDQNFREIEIFGRPLGTSESFNIDENIDIADVVYTALATADASATRLVVYSLGGTDAAFFNIGGSSGEVTFIVSPDYESGKTRYSFSVIATTSLPTPMSGIRKIELFIQDVEEPATINLTDPDSTFSITEGTALTADRDTGSVFSFSDSENDTYTYTVSDNRFELQNNQLVAQSGAVFDYDILTNGQLSVTITATNTADASETYDTDPITISITNVYDAPVFSIGTSSDTIASVTNLAPDATVDTSDITDWYTDGILDTAAKHIANINDGDTNAVEYGFAVHPQSADGKAISFDLGGDYVQGSFIYYNDNGGSVGDGRVNGSTVEFIKDGAIVYSEVITAGSGHIETITAPVDIIFDTARIVFSGNSQNFREIEVFGRLVGSSESFNIDENIDIADVVYTASATADILATSAVVYSLGGTDANSFNIVESTGVITFKVSPDYETKPRYVFDVIATTDQPSIKFASHRVELSIQDVEEPSTISLEPSTSRLTFDENSALGSDMDTGYVLSFSDPEGDPYTYTVSDSRFAVDANNHLIVQSGAVFDYEDLSSSNGQLSVTITATNDADASETYDTASTHVLNITNVYGAPVFSTGTSSGTIFSAPNLAPNATIITRSIIDWSSDLSDAEHIANINDGDLTAVLDGSAVIIRIANGKEIIFDLGGDYVYGSFIYHNRNDGYGLDRVNGSTVAFIKDRVIVYSEVIANAGYIETITAPVGTVFDTARIVFSGDYQNFREIEVLGRLEGSTESILINIDENIDTADVVYDALATADALATSAVVYSLGGTDVALLNIDTSTGEVTFIASPDYEDKSYYVFDVIATTNQPTPMSATRRVELFIQDVNDAPDITVLGPQFTFNEGTLTADRSTGLYVSASDQDGDTYTYTVSDSRFALDASNNLIAQSGAVFDYDTEPSVDVVITATNTTDASEMYQESTTISITNVYEDPVFSEGITLNETSHVAISNLSLNTVTTTEVTTNIPSWSTISDVDTAAEHIANINDGDTNAVLYGSAVVSYNANGKYISFDLDKDNSGRTYIQGSFIYYNRNDGYALDRVNGSTVDFINDGVSVYSEVIANAGNIVTITAPVDTLFDTARITFSGDLQHFREIEVFGRPVGYFNVNENYGTTVSVYTLLTTVDASVSVVYSLSGTDAALFNVGGSLGEVTFMTSPDYESGKTRYSFSVTVTTTDSNGVPSSGTRSVELFIQDVNEAPTISFTTSTRSITEGRLTADFSTGFVVSVSDPEGDTYSLTTNNSRFALDASNNLFAQSGAVFDFETEPSVDVVITATNTADASEVYTRSTTVSITNVYEDPVFSAGTSPAGTIADSVSNVALNTVIDTDITQWWRLGDVDTAAENIANINDGNLTAVAYGSAVGFDLNGGEYISFDLGGDYVQGSFIYHNRNDETYRNYQQRRVNGSTVEFIKDGVSVYSEVIANAEANTDNIVTITAPVRTVFDTARIVFPGDYWQNFREIEVFGRLVGSSDSFNIDEDHGTIVSVYTPSVTVDSSIDLATTGSLVYTLGGTDAALFNIGGSSGEVTFKVSPNYETKTRYVFDVIATTTDSNSVSLFATRQIELFIQEVVPVPPTIEFTDNGTVSIPEGTLTADRDTGRVLSFYDPENEPYTYTVDDSRFVLDSNNQLVAQSGAVFDYETEPSVVVVITATNDANANETYQESTTISITDVREIVFSTGMSSATPHPVTNIALDVIPTTDVEPKNMSLLGFTHGDLGETPEEHIANINDGDLEGVVISEGDGPVDLSFVFSSGGDGKYIRFAWGEDYMEGSFIYHNRRDVMYLVDDSTVEFIRDGATVYSEVIANAGEIVTITAPVDTVFDTARIVFSGHWQGLREIEVFARRAESFDIDENIDITTYEVYTASATPDTSTTMGGALVYTLGGTDGSDFNIDPSSGAVTFIASPDYETKAYYDFDVIVTTTDSTAASGTRHIELFIQDIYETPTIGLTTSTVSLDEGTLIADRDTGRVVSFSDPEGEPYRFTTNDNRFAVEVDANDNYHLIAKEDAVFDYETESSVDVVITATNIADTSETYQASTTISITNVYDAPVFSAGINSSGTPLSATNITPDATIDTDITSWETLEDVDTPEEHIANINDGDTDAVLYGSAVYPTDAAGKHISFDFSRYYSNGEFRYHNRNDEYDSVLEGRVNGSTVEFIKDGVAVYSEVIANAEANTDNIVTITTPMGTVFDTARITFSGDLQNFREIEVFGRLLGSELFNIDENIDIATYVVYRASATPDALAISSVVYSLSGADGILLNIDTSTGVVTFKVSPDYETQSEYSFSVIATTIDSNNVLISAIRSIELFIQDVNDVPDITVSGTAIAIDEGTLTADSDTGFIVSVSDQDGDTFSFTTNDSRFELRVSDNHLIAKDDAVFDYETESSVDVVITATNDADSNEVYTRSTTISITNVYDAPVFSTGTSSSTIPSVINLALNTVTTTTVDTDITSWWTGGGTSAEQIAKINDGDLTALESGSAVFPRSTDGTYIRLDLGGDYVQGSFIYHNRNDGQREHYVNGSTVAFIKDGVAVYSEVITNAEDNTDNIVTITAPVDTVFDTARITFLGDRQFFREIEVFGRPVGSAWFDIDENIDIATYVVYTPSVTPDALATTGSLVYTLGGTDASDFNIVESTGVVTFKVSPDYETKTRYVFDVIATTTDSNSVPLSATRPVELFIQDVYEAPTINLTDPDSTFSITEGTALTADRDTGSVFSFSDPERESYTYTVDDNRFKLVEDNSSATVVYNLTAKNGAVFDFEAGSDVDVVITATNDADSNEVYTRSTTISITNVYEAPVFSTGMSSGTVVLSNLALNAVIDTDIASWLTLGDVDTPEEHIANINDGDLTAVLQGSAIAPQSANSKYISFALGGDYGQGSFIYHNRNDGTYEDRVNGSTVEFIKDGVTVDEQTITNAEANAEANTDDIVTITAPVDTVFDTARITFSGDLQNFREIEVFGRLVELDSFNIDENIATTVSIYTALATADALAVDAITYTLGGTDAALFNIVESSGVVTFIVFPDYETQSEYSFSVIATTNQPTPMSATRSVELFIQDVNDAPVVANLIEDQSLNEGANLDFTLPSDVFSDADTEDTLTYTATQADEAGSALPSWISFNASTGNFSGTAPSVNTTISIRVTATDSGDAYIYDDFDIVIMLDAV